VSYVPTLSISIEHDHIKGSTSRFQKSLSPPYRQTNGVIESSRFRSWVGYTTSTEEEPDNFYAYTEIPEERIPQTSLCF
jgi:hypothetical protein